MMSSIPYFILAILFRVILEFSYVLVVTDVFGYAGYEINFELVEYCFSWGLYLFCILFSNSEIKKVSDYFFATFLFGLICPASIMYGYDLNRPLSPILTLVFSMSLVYLIVNLKAIRLKPLPLVKGGDKVVICMSLIFVLFLAIWYPAVGVTFNLNMERVYEFRRDNASLANVGILAYVNNWVFQIFNITLLVICLFYRRYFLVLCVLIIQVYFFAASAHKSVLFYPFLVFGIWYYYRHSNSAMIIPLVFSLVVLATLVSFILFEDILMTSLFSRRVFFVPARLTYDYFEFFTLNEPLYWSNSILKHWVTNPYNEAVGYVIGQYLGKENLNANNGYISMGFAHAGYFGVAIYVMLSAVLLRFLDSMTKASIPLWVALALTVVPIRSFLISTDILTTLLTHGLVIVLIVLYLLRGRMKQGGSISARGLHRFRRSIRN